MTRMVEWTVDGTVVMAASATAAAKKVMGPAMYGSHWGAFSPDDEIPAWVDFGGTTKPVVCINAERGTFHCYEVEHG